MQEQISKHVSEGNFQEAMALLDAQLARQTDPNLAMFQLAVAINAESTAKALEMIERIYAVAPNLSGSGLRESIVAHDTYIQRRTATDQQRQSVTGAPSPAHLARVKASYHHAVGEHALVKQTLAEWPSVTGPGGYRRFNGAVVQFKTLTDSDDLFGPILYCVTPGGLFDVPLDAVRKFELHPPKMTFEQMLRPITVTMRDGRTLQARIPLRYPGAGSHPEAAVRLARTTVWDYSHGYSIASGMVDFRTDSGIVGLGTITELWFD